MARFTLERGRWYAAELIGEEFGKNIRSYSPIRVDDLSVRGGRMFTLNFYHANYLEGVRDKAYELQTIERTSTFILSRSLTHEPARLMLIYPISGRWLRDHFEVRISAVEDPQTWLTRNA